MAHGLPDYGESSPNDSVAAITDLGELAARIGTAFVYDRRGNAVLVDELTDGIAPWQILTSGAGETAAIENAHWHFKKGAMRLSVAAAGGSYINASRSTPFGVNGRLGIMSVLSIDASMSYVQMGVLALVDGGSNLGVVKIDLINNSIAIYTGGAWVGYPGYDRLAFSDDAFIFLKLIIDTVTGKYARLIVNSYEFDFDPPPALYLSHFGQPISLTAQLTCYGDGAHVSHAIIDSVIFTINEP